MDYDDNQHAPRNTRLGSEDNNKFPPGLRSYPLPKFDLDEHFQVPVEFDSLGERGILLDLPSQSGDHWIDDYSRDDNRILILDPVSESIEFGSAEESCTIPRKNNVWSEAASSESVEMLLNSVGQDETVTNKGDGAKSDVCDTHVPLSKQMDTGPCGDDSTFKISNVSCADPRVSPDNSLISSSSLEKHDWKDVSSVEGMPENVIDNRHEHQEHGHLTTNELHEKEGSSPNSSSKQCSSIIESFQHSTADFSLDSKRCSDEDAHMKHVGFQQIEGSLLGECPLHVEYVVKKDTICCTPAISEKEPSERLVEKLSNTEMATYHTREVSEDDLCQKPQATVIADADNDDTKQFPSIQAEIINHPVEDEFVDRKSNLIAEAHYVEESSIIAGTPSLVQKVTACGNKTENKHDLVSLDLSCRKVHTASADEVILDLDSKFPQEVADARAGNSKVTPAIVNDFSELLTGQSPALSKPMAHGNIGLHSLISFSENASQQSHCTKPCEDDSASSHTDIVKGVFASNIGPKVLTSRHGLAMNNTGQSPSRFAQEDTSQSEMVMREIYTSESVAEAKCLSTACKNQEMSQIRSKSGVLSTYASSCSEGTFQNTTEADIASNKEDTEQKEKKPDLPGSGETGNQGRVPSNSLDMPVDWESQLATKDDLSSVSGKHACLSVGAVPDLIIHSSALLQYSTNNVQHSKLGTSEAEKATRQNSPKKGSSGSCPPSVEQTDSSAVFEVSLKKSKFSEVPVADKQSGEDEQLKHPIVSSAPSTSNTSSSKGPTSEAGILLSEENERQNCSSSIDIQSCPSAQAEVLTLANSSEPGLKEACSDGMELTLAPNSVDASNSVKGGSCNPEVLKTDTDPYKVDNNEKVAADCGSPTIISCKESHQDEVHHHETENQSLPQHPTSGNAPGASSSTTGQSDGMKASDQNPDMCDTPESDKSFTFKIGNLSGSSLTEKSGKNWKQFPSTGPTELFQTTRSAEGTSDVNPQMSEEKKMIEAGKSRSKSKTRSRSGDKTERATTGKGKPKKEPSSRKLTSLAAGNDKHHEGNASAGSSKSAIGSPIQLEESKRLAHVEGSTTKPYSVTSIQASPPVLNAFASSALALFQQPFTDMQQLQLRAQIFVYGYLIRGAAPDEACMVSAFGGAGRDGGRNMWENVWRVAVERADSQKPLPASPEIPIIHSGMKVVDQGSRGNSGPSKSSVVSASRNTNKSSPVAILNPAVSLPSPIWNATPSSPDLMQSSSMARTSLIDPHPTFAPYHLYSSPQIRPFTGHFSSWPSQVSSPVPWILSHTSTLDAGSQYAAFSVPDTVQVTPIHDHAAISSVGVTPNVQVVTSTPLPSTAAAANVPVDVKKTTVDSPVDVKKITSASIKQPSADQKTRKKGKSVPSEDNQLLNVQQSQAGSISSMMVNTHVSAPLTLTAAGIPFVSAVSMSKTSSGAPASLSPPTALPTPNYHISDHGTVQRTDFSEEAGIQVEQAKLCAEDAEALAASAARHSQELWNQLTAQRNSKLATNVEGRLCSALASAAAAASVAKAAAAAAKVAANAALQAKLMADEALTKKKLVASCGTGDGISEVGKNFANVTPGSVSKGKVRQDSMSSVVEFAKEAARKGVEAASAATQRAQNLDAVVKASCLAAEAISQATAIVAMGDPLPLTLNQLLEAGPEGYWKHQDLVSRLTLESTAKEVKHSGETNSFNVKVSCKNGAVQGAKGTNTNISKESLGGTTEDGQGLVNSSAHKEVAHVKIASKRRQRAHKASGSAIACETIPSSVFESQNASVIHFDGPEKSVRHDSSEGNWIQQGSLVEVISDEDGLRAVWFAAKVLEVKEGKAYVCYNDLLSDEGTGQLKEWIPLEAVDGKPPRIRVAHPMTSMQFEGTRKRHRATMENRNWSVGDHVDVRMRDGWWEGVIMERIKVDQTKLTVRFPAEGDISTVNTWNVRPSLVWKDGQWVEWSSETASWLHEDDAPLDKRQKLDKKLENDDQNEGNGGSKITKCADTIKQQNSTSFALSSGVFSVGKSTAVHDLAGRVKRTGLQKGGSRVVFGVPKPGKKRKFMDVSKHYITEQVGKSGQTNNPVKVASYLIPRGSSRLRNVSKDVPKSVRATITRSKDVKSGKLQGIERKSRSKDGSSMSALPPSVGATDDQSHGEPSASNEGNSERQNRREIVFSGAAGEQDSSEISSRNKPSSVRVRQVPKRKVASAGQGLSSDEAIAATDRQGKAALEPRRSNRRIQPTSRLLEGLQSSLITTKVSSGGLHDKGGKSSKKSANSSVKGNSYGEER